MTTLREIHLEADGFAAAFAFKATRDIRAVAMGETDTAKEYMTDERDKMNILNDFLYEEFTREVGIGTEHLYRTSEIIAKWWFDGPPDLQDAWSYPSVQARPALNIVFRPAKDAECLGLRGVMLGKMQADGQFSIKAIGVVEDEKFVYYPVGSGVQKQVFPEIVDRSQN